MAKKLLIDANHPEEIRVAVVHGHTLDEFDSETSTKKQIKGNIYLAKVIRIEPSLQAAFVDFGGNRHGFLPFSEIHPDYYHIPISDREALAKEIEKSAPALMAPLVDDAELVEEENSEHVLAHHDELNEETHSDTDTLLSEDEEENSSVSETDEAGEEKVQTARKPRSYRYKIQEVVKRRQIMLVQVVKEERGNKGAALTTYLSLPGRYCVLMPNAGHRAGGVSRKIHDGEDRRRLRDMVKEMEVPDGMALIVRTAGQERNKTEIRRDYEYLMRLWTDIRDLTLKSIAPAVVYAEGDLVKRAIRDIYSRDIDEVLVEGEEAYKAAKAFMRTLIPSHARKVQPYKDTNVPLFHRFRVEEQIDQIMYPAVKLPSGGSIVVNTTEALVAIDVNSGKSTRERHIDETALKTNLEAADEIARQMRLRDLAGLIVIDFIDMNDHNHIQQVERRLREAIRTDRARIQLGKISQFGLMELSRQRLRPSLLETHTTTCNHCHGTGLVRSTESMALHVLRALETRAIQGGVQELLVTVPSGIDLYLLNQKRHALLSVESRFGINVQVNRDISISPPDFRIDVLAEREREQPLPRPRVERAVEQIISVEEAPLQKSITKPEEAEEATETNEEVRRGRRRRPRRRHPRAPHEGGEGLNPVENISEASLKEEATSENKSDSEASNETTQESVDREQPRRDDNGRRRSRHHRNFRHRRRPYHKGTDEGGVAVEHAAPQEALPPKREEKIEGEKKSTNGSTRSKTNNEQKSSEEGGQGKKPRKGWLRRLLSDGE